MYIYIYMCIYINVYIYLELGIAEAPCDKAIGEYLGVAVERQLKDPAVRHQSCKKKRK